MKRFTLLILLIYTIVSVVFVGTIIIIEKNAQRENNHPRKNLYIINQTNDTISVWLSGSYTDSEKKKLKDKPDTYIFPEQVDKLPYFYSDGAKAYAMRIHLPFKCDKEINFPENFSIHIQNQYGEITLTREQFMQLTKGEISDNTWALYIDKHIVSPSPEPQEEVPTAAFD